MSVARSASLPPSIHIRLDDAAARVLIELCGPASGRYVAETLSQAYLTRPELTRLDMLFDLTGYEGDVEAQHLEMIVAAYLRGNMDPLRPCRTAFVTPDPYFNCWAAAMSFQFVGREHRAFATFGEAERFLGEPIEERAAYLAA